MKDLALKVYWFKRSREMNLLSHTGKMTLSSLRYWPHLFSRRVTGFICYGLDKLSV